VSLKGFGPLSRIRKPPYDAVTASRVPLRKHTARGMKSVFSGIGVLENTVSGREFFKLELTLKLHKKHDKGLSKAMIATFL